MRWIKVVLCLILSLTSFASIPYLQRQEKLFYSRNEPFFINPAPNKSGVLYIRSDSYGKGYYGASRNGGRSHKGIDVMAAVGSSIVAAKSGRVVVAGIDSGYGDYIEIQHPDGLCTRYAHLSRSMVQVGDWVKRGQLIGKSGKSGNARNARIIPHLHFEVRQGADAVNPTSGLLDPSILVK